ncbi:MAG: hypothetical protein KA297_24115 [Kofleriaceae bacterium]|nr:hypothetical protein [Kofleriaceae bacterium]
MLTQPTARRGLLRSSLALLRLLATLSLALWLSACLSYSVMTAKSDRTKTGYALATGAWLATAAMGYAIGRSPHEDPETGMMHEPQSHEASAGAGLAIASGADLLMASFMLGLTESHD